MILVDGESTGGHLGLIRDVVPAGHAGPRLHLHPGFDESFYVLAGFERYFADGAAHARPPDESTIVIGGRLDEA